MDIADLERKLGIDGISAEQQMEIITALQQSAAEKIAKAKSESIGKGAELVIQGLKKIKSDMEQKFAQLNGEIQSKVASIQDGQDGKDGKDGRDGKQGPAGATGPAGRDGIPGRDGVDGNDGIGVATARIDFDGSLIITLDDGREINAGEVVPLDIAERIKVITNGGGTSQYVLDTLASLQTQINAISGGLSYQGTWNASTNTPTLTSSSGTSNYYYVVSVSGSTNLNGITDWVTGDWAIYNGTVWQKIDQTNLVTSVAGRTGAVTLSNTDISGLGTMSTQNASSVAITGGSESAVSHSGDTISNYLSYTPATAPSYQEGRTWYDSTAKAIAYYNDVSNVTVHVGHDLQFKVINNTGSTIANGSPVYITGTSSGQTYPNIALAKADVASTSTVIGLTDGAITNGSVGYVTSTGNIDNVNTGTFTVGQVLYLSPYSAGQLMNTIPPTGITVQVGMVTYVDSSAGKIYVKQTTPLNVPASIISGTVAVANGGTGLTSFAANGIVYASSTSALSTSSTLSFDGTTLTATGNAIISDNSANAALRITQIGAGNALLVEDSANPDATPFVIDSGGKIKNGYLTDWSGITAPRIGVDANNSAAFATTSFGYNTAAPIFSSVVGGGTTFGSNTIVSSGQNLGRYRWYGTDGTAPILAASMEALVDGTPGTNDMPGRLVFSTTADGASSPTERLRITSAGAFGLAGANYGTSGQVLTSGGTSAAPTWTTPVAASAPKLLTTNFTIEESGGKLLFKYGATTIASMDSTGVITSATNIVANGTP